MDFISKFLGELLVKLIVKLTPKQYAWTSILLIVLGIGSSAVSVWQYDVDGTMVPLVQGAPKIIFASLTGIVTVVLGMLNINPGNYLPGSGTTTPSSPSTTK